MCHFVNRRGRWRRSVLRTGSNQGWEYVLGWSRSRLRSRLRSGLRSGSGSRPRPKKF